MSAVRGMQGSRERAPLPPDLVGSGPGRMPIHKEKGAAKSGRASSSAQGALAALDHFSSTPPANRGGDDDHLRRSLEKAAAVAAARTWLSNRAFSEPEMEEVEVLMEDFTLPALEELGEDGVRAKVRELAGGATGAVESHRPRSRPRRSQEVGNGGANKCSCSRSPVRDRSCIRGDSPPPTPEHVRTGMFVNLHKNEGLSSPHRRFFRFNAETHIVNWTKKEPKRRSSDTEGGGKYAKVVCAKADIPTVRRNRGLDYSYMGRCLRLQTLTHGTLNLEMEQESDAKLWLDVIRDAGVTAEALEDAAPHEEEHLTVGRSPYRRAPSGRKQDDQRHSAGGSVAYSLSAGEDDVTDGHFIEKDSDNDGLLYQEGNRLDEASWNTARDAFHDIAMRNVDTLKSEYEAMATEAVHKFLLLGTDAEINLLESLTLRTYTKDKDLITQGADGHEFFILLDGTCVVEMNGQYIRTVQAPNAFGESALITDSKRSGTVRAASDTVQVAVLSKVVFDRLASQRDYPHFWHRSSLKTKFSAAHQQRLGQTGEITMVIPQSDEVEVEFQDHKRLRFPTGALGLLPIANTGSSLEPEQEDIDPIFRHCDAPTNSETRTLGILEDWMLRRPELKLHRVGDLAGRKVAVMRDINVAKSYFQRVEEVYHIDQYALKTSTAYFIAAWILGAILGFNWGSLVIGFVLLINAFFCERSRHTRLYSEVQNHVHGNWHRTVERNSRRESPEWVNQILNVSWVQMGVEKQLSQQIIEQTNPMLEDMSTWYSQVEKIKLESLTLGQNPPQINNLHFENSDVFGEFRINAEARLDAPDCLAQVSVHLVKSPPFNVELTDLNINADFQLLVRLSSDNGLTLVGVKLRKKLGLDYAISTKLTKNLQSIGGFHIQKFLNEQIQESLWWMTDPCMLLLPWYPAANSTSPSFVAGSDMEASFFDKPVGQLEIRVKSAKNLPAGDWHSKSSDPYVQFCVEKSWPLRQFKSRMVKKNLNPVFEHVVTTSLRWNESQTGVLLFEVFDHNEGWADDRLGMAEVPIKMVVEHYDGLSSQKKDVSLRLRELSDEKDREASKHDPALLHLSMTYYPTYKSPRVPMTREAKVGCVKGGVLQLEVVSVKNLRHGMDKLYAIIAYGTELDETKARKRDRNAWRDGAEHINTRSEDYSPGTFTNDYYRSKDVDPEDCFKDMPENERSTHKRHRCPVKWRDMPVGFKAYHEICVGDCCDGIQISIMSPELGKDKCHAKFFAPTVPDLMTKMQLLEGNHCMNGVTKEQWVDLELVTKHGLSGAGQSVKGAVHKGVRGMGKGVSGAGKSVTKLGKGVTKEAQRLVRRDQLTFDEDDDAESSDDDDWDAYDEWDTLQADGTSKRPQVRLAASFWACRMHTKQPHHEEAVRSPDDDWRPTKDGTLSVRLISASNLIPADDNGLSDPYANLCLGFQEQIGANGAKHKQSKVKQKTLHPHWDETFLFRVNKFSTDADNMLTIAIFDKDAVSSDDFLGSAEVNLTEEFRGQWIDHEIDKQFVLKDPEMRIKPKAKRRGDALVASRRDKKWSDAPLGRVHLRIGFHPDLETQTAGRDRGLSVMSLRDSFD